MTHLTFEEISDLADRKVESRARHRAAESHLAECRECQETMRRVQHLVATARALPRDVEPPAETWAALRARMGGAAPRRAVASRWRLGWLASAAAIIIVAGVALLVPGRPGVGKGKAKGAPVAVADPAMHLAVERSYAATVAELRRTLEAQRPALAPATIRVLERSLATIDTAIAEARAALASDPANQALTGILSANYERKVELLKRATEISTS